MNMTTMRMYCPSLKENVEATITDGKQVASKGGSLRNIIYGEFEGKKCLPKTVKADVFAQHGFKAESVIIHGEKEGRKTKPVAHKVGIEEKDGFVPNRINIPSTMNPPYTVETSSLKTGVFENHAENSEKMNLTMKELLILILVNKDWNENDWGESGEYEEITASFYHDEVDMNKMRGVLSSLVKKGIITAGEDYVNKEKFTMVSVNNKYTHDLERIDWNMFDCKDEVVQEMGYEKFVQWANNLPDKIIRGMMNAKFDAETSGQWEIGEQLEEAQMNAEFLYYYVLNEKGESPADFDTLEEAQAYVANSNEPLEIYERRSRDDEADKMDKKMNQFDAERTLKGVQINRKNKNRSTLTYRDVDGILYKTNREWILKIDSRNIKTDVDSFAKGLEAFKRHIDMNISNIGYDAETFEAYEDQISERQEYKINSLGGKIDASMNRSDASDYIKKLMGKQSGTWKEAESSPSSFDISWEDAQGVSSPSLPPEGIHFAEQGDYRMNGEGCEYCAETRELNAEGFCSECASHAESFSASSYEDAFFTETVSEMAAEGISRNGKLALSLTALGIGVAMALGSDNVSSLLDKITRK